MDYDIKTVLQAAVCAFCETVYITESLDENEFFDSLDFFLHDSNLQNSLERCTEDVLYDTRNIDNICRRKKLKDTSFDYGHTVSCCRIAHSNTLNKDKTINVEAFTDNLAKELSEI